MNLLDCTLGKNRTMEVNGGLWTVPLIGCGTIGGLVYRTLCLQCKTVQDVVVGDGDKGSPGAFVSAVKKQLHCPCEKAETLCAS